MRRLMLHDFDAALCHYVRGTVGAYTLGDTPRDRQFREWLAGSLDPRLFTYLHSPREPELLLGERELEALGAALFCLPLELFRRWVPWAGLHARYVGCLPEIRQGLGATADVFAIASLSFAERLEARTLEVHAGVEVVGEWIDEVRRLRPDDRTCSPQFQAGGTVGDAEPHLRDRVRLQPRLLQDPAPRNSPRNSILAVD